MAQATEVGICNQALAKLGNSLNLIASLEDRSKEAKQCKLFYAQARDEVLEEYPWPWAMRRNIPLALISENTDAGAQYKYTYSYPSDCLMIKRLVANGCQDVATSPFSISIADNLTSNIIETDVENAVLTYIAKVTNPIVFKNMFITALSYKIAAYICMPLTSSTELMLSLGQFYQATLADASIASMNEQGNKKSPDPDFLDIRSSGMGRQI